MDSQSHGRRRRASRPRKSFVERLEDRGMMATIAEFAVAAGARPFAIATGPDGALWFTDPALGGIGRISTDGTATEFPTVGSRPFWITPGPDDNLWFTERQ